jgi:hypothetical protein
MVGKLRDTVVQMGQASWGDTAGSIAALAEQLADGFDAAGLGQSAGAALRQQAKELRGLEQLSLERTDRVKEALGAAVTGLEELGAASGPDLDSWTMSAVRAVRAIDPHVPLGLERAQVQDAARAVVDAFAAAVTLSARCR